MAYLQHKHQVSLKKIMNLMFFPLNVKWAPDEPLKPVYTCLKNIPPKLLRFYHHVHKHKWTATPRVCMINNPHPNSTGTQGDKIRLHYVSVGVCEQHLLSWNHDNHLDTPAQAKRTVVALRTRGGAVMRLLRTHTRLLVESKNTQSVRCCSHTLKKKKTKLEELTSMNSTHIVCNLDYLRKCLSIL